MICQTTYAGGQANYYPYTRNISVSDVYKRQILSVPTLVYLPYRFFNIISPLNSESNPEAAIRCV